MMKSKATDFLYEWRSKPIDSWNDIMRYWNELWKTKEEYEEELKNEVKGH